MLRCSVTRARPRQLRRGPGGCCDGDSCVHLLQVALPPSLRLPSSLPPSLPPSLPQAPSLRLPTSLPPSLPPQALPPSACLSASCLPRQAKILRTPSNILRTPSNILHTPQIFYVPIQVFTRKGDSTSQFTTPGGKGRADWVSTASQVRFT